MIMVWESTYFIYIYIYLLIIIRYVMHEYLSMLLFFNREYNNYNTDEYT